MPSDTQQIVNEAWNSAHVLRDGGLSYMVCAEPITLPLFLEPEDWTPMPADVEGNVCEGLPRARTLDRDCEWEPRGS